MKSKKLYNNSILKKILLLVFISLSFQISNVTAQSLITGQVTDEEFGEPLDRAIVQIRGTSAYTVTNREGKFKMKLPAYTYEIEAIYPGIYSEYYNVSGYDDIFTPMGAVRLAPKYVGRPEQRRTAALINVLQFPKASESYSVPDLLDQSGSTNFNELFLGEPSAYLIENGSYYGSSELKFRGFNASQTTVLFNGIKMNDPETGNMNTSLYTGMSDWAGLVQLQTGQASSNRSDIGYGALINILPFMPYDKAGAKVSANMGNYNFMKGAVTAYSGLNKKNFASTLKIDRASGDGFVEETGFESYGAYLNLYKEINHMHSFILTGIMKTWQSDQRKNPTENHTYSVQGFNYNQSWGLLNNTPTSLNQSFGINPMAILTHNWHARVNTRIVSQIYAELNNSVESYPDGEINGVDALQLPTDTLDQPLLDDYYSWNSGNSVSELGSARIVSNNQFINSKDEGFSILGHAQKSIRYGFQSQLIHNINKKSKFQVSIDVENYQADHFETVIDLYGADGYISYADQNTPGGIEVTNLLKPSFLPKLNDADKIGFNYRASIMNAGASAKIEKTGGRSYLYAEAAASVRILKRKDLFSYTNDSELQSSEKVNQPTFRATTGYTYLLHDHHSVRINAAISTAQPNFYEVFPGTNNGINNDAKMKTLSTAELAYVISGGRVYLALKGYASYLEDQGWIQRNNLSNPDNFAYIFNTDQLHYGGEFSGQISFLRRFTLYASGSFGNWEYFTNATAKIYDNENNLLYKKFVDMKGFKVGNAPQMSYYVKAEMRMMKGLFFNLSYYRAENMYTPALINYTDLPEYPTQFKTSWFNRMGFGASYFHETSRGHTIHFSADFQNLQNNEYINQIFTNYTGKSVYQNSVFMGNGQTFRIGLSYSL